MKKEIKFSARLDTGDFDRTVEALQRKLKDIYKGSDQSRLGMQNLQRASSFGIGPGATPADRQRLEQMDTKSRRETDAFIKTQIKDQEELARRLNRLGQEKQRLLQMDKLDIDQKERLSRLNEKIASGQGRMAGMDVGIREALDRKGSGTWGDQGGWGRVLNAYRGGGIGGAMGAGGRMFGDMSTAGKIGAGANVFGFMGSALQVGGMLTQDSATRPRETVAAAAGASSGGALGLQNVAAGRGFQDVFYRAEMKRAIKMADEENSKSRTADKMKAAGQILGILAGAAMVVGSGGTLLPLVGGAMLGGGALGLHRQGAGALGVNIGGRADRYEAEKERERSQAFVTNYGNLKEMNQIKKIAFEDFQKNFQSDLGMQRQLGLSDIGMNTMYRGGTSAGFTREMTRGAAGGIIGAGGSTGAAQGMSTTANMLARSMDLTNSASLIGKLSGTTGGAGSANATDKMLASLIASGMKAGLDGSEFREENRKFLENTATIIRAVGASSPESAAAIAKAQTSFLADKSIAGIDAATQAQKLMSGIQKSSTGAGANLELGTLLSSKELGGASPMDLAAFMSMDENEIRSLSDEELSSFGDPTEVRKLLLQSKDVKMFGDSPEMANRVEKLRKMKENGMSTSDLMKTPEFFSARRAFQTTDKTTPMIAASQVMKAIGNPEDIDQEALTRGIGRFAETKGMGGEITRVGDQAIQTAAQDEQLILMLREKMPMAIGRTTEEFENTTEKLLALQKKLEEATAKSYETGKFGEVTDIARQLSQIFTDDQQQSSSASSEKSK